MHWIAPSEKDTVTNTLVSSLSASQGAGLRCWPSGSADRLHAHSGRISFGGNVNRYDDELHKQVSADYPSND